MSNIEVISLPSAISYIDTENSTNLARELERCQQELEKNNSRIQGCLATNDFGAMLAAIISEDHKLPGMGADSVVACRHKYFQRRITVPEMLINSEQQFFDTPIKDVCYPCYAKLPIAHFAVGARLLKNRTDHNNYVCDVYKEAKRYTNLYAGIPKKYLVEYPDYLRPSYLLEKPVTLDQVTIMGESRRGVHTITTIVDTCFHKGTQNIHTWRWPSAYNDDIQSALCNLALDAVAKLGFNTGIWNVEAWIDKQSGNIKIIEINPRPATFFHDLLDFACGYNIYQHMVDVITETAPPQVLNPQKKGFAEQQAVTTTKEGLLRDLVDYPTLAGQPNTIMHLEPDRQVRQVSPYPIMIAARLTWSA